MKATKLISVLKLLSDKEIAWFRHFIENPMFNRRKDMILALEFLTGTGIRSFENEHLFRHVYKERKYNDKDLHLLTSRLFKLLEDFLACRDMMADPVLKKIHLAKSYRKLIELPPGDKQDREILQTEIGKAKILTEKEWLLQQIAQHDRQQFLP